METPELGTADYWEDEGIDVRLNPRRTVETSGLREFLQDEYGFRSAVVLATSGSSGRFKFVVLKKSALLASADGVVEHCGIRPDDVWLAGLSDFHVGGLGIYARAYVAGSRVVTAGLQNWQKDGGPLVGAIEKAGATLTSMTPTHVYDLVGAGAESPSTLRGVLLGGGPIDAALVDRARDLGWNLWPSYGMTEACSQIATSVDGAVKWMPILPHWECRRSADGRLEIRGEALFSGYVFRRDGAWEFDPGTGPDGWFRTGDRCELREGGLRFESRADDLVKVSGELVSVSAVEKVVLSSCRCVGANVAVLAIPDSRRGHELVAFVESTAVGASTLAGINGQLDGIERVSRIIPVVPFPRTDIGKIDRESLREIAGGVSD